ncbi:4-alpha-glucanotransferase [Actibacterium sp. 188UL27-1]|uniref:4-alpha-glucanotransferase n=1 Tax=Actibacterium sp. 188UL27-1 TaxID=2786961 RepID=UPI001955FD62|nr:4-alpha-glucanotransferase [Actibacterium sp. 188UL27-1]
MPRQTASTGIFCHISSLPGPFGCGTLGASARRFVRLLADRGIAIWQILPADALDDQDSPYMAKSAMGGNSAFVDFDDLAADGFPDVADYTGPSDRYDFDAVRAHRLHCFDQLSNWVRSAPAAASHREGMAAFRAAEADWLTDYVAFATIREVQGGTTPWWEWPDALRDRDPASVNHIMAIHRDIADRYVLEQYLFHRQWFALRTFATQHRVEIVGDVPIYVDGDSADVWANRGHFALDRVGRPAQLSGTPPDYFCADGQCWGSPVYDWETLARDDYGWWIRRLARAQRLYDRFRIDHFRALAAYWSIPAATPDPQLGAWRPGPGAALLTAAYAQIPGLQIIIEDLGAVDKQVFDLRDAFGLPSMHVVQLVGQSDIQQIHFLENHRAVGWAYLGNHDTPTTLAWLTTLSSNQRALFLDEIRKAVPTAETLDLDGLLAYTLSSRCAVAILCLQDLMRLGDEGTMNTPGTVGGNWDWRVADADQLPDAMDYMAALIARYRPALPFDAPVAEPGNQKPLADQKQHGDRQA